jgi:hypothetical protein
LLETGRDVHTFSVAIITLNNHFTEVDANTHLEAFVLGYCGVSLGKSALQCYSALNGVNNAAEFGQQPVPHELKDTPMVALNLWFEQLLTAGF